jgi:acyl carrier protein
MGLMDSTRQMKDVTPENVRKFLLARYSGAITAMQLNLTELPDDFDLLLSGVIDSFGILEMISAIEENFQIELDLTALDAEQITVLGPLSRYVAERGYRRNVPDSGGA